MTRLIPLLVTISVATALQAQRPLQFGVLTSFAKTPTRTDPNGRVFMGPQDAFYVTWVLGNRGDLVVVPSPDTVLTISVTTGGRPVAVTTAWEPTMRRRATQVPFDEPLGQTVLADDEAVTVYAVVRRADGQSFDPAEYVLMLDISRLGPALRTTGGSRWLGQSTGGGAVRVTLDSLNSPAAILEYHHIEAAFYIGHQPEKVLDHRLAAVALPGAQLGDRMALGKAYAELGRHDDAVRTYDPLLPELVKDAQAGGLIRTGRHLRFIAVSYIAVGDLDTARRLLEAEGLTRVAEIPEALRRLSPRPDARRGNWYRR